MNSELDLIFGRRSIRKYKDESIPEQMIQDILDAAMAAPSACCKDPWQLVVVTSGELLAEISEGLPHGKMLADAPLGIVVCGDIDQAHDNQESYMLQDCSAAIQNILLAVHALGLGACWLGVHPREDRIAHIKALLDTPDNIIPISVIAIGRPDEAKEPRTRFDESKVQRL